MTPDCDILIAGAGAAGLMAGIAAAEAGRRVLLLEKNRRPGVKILMSGGTRCNITHATDNRGIVSAYGPPGRFLHSALAALFRSHGIAAERRGPGPQGDPPNRPFLCFTDRDPEDLMLHGRKIVGSATEITAPTLGM